MVATCDQTYDFVANPHKPACIGRYAMSMARRPQASMQLIDSQRHGTGCELFLVEGESAAGAVNAVRDARMQAVLPLQGKPLNAWRASAGRVAAYPLYAQLAAALGWPSPVATTGVAPADLRFERLLLLLDPDADGIHIGALLLLYLQRFAPDLLAQARVLMVRPPMAGLRVAARDTGEVEDVWAYTPSQARALRERAATQVDRWLVLHEWGFRGLASLPPEVLRETCVDAATRRADAVTAQDMRAVMDVFGGAG